MYGSCLFRNLQQWMVNRIFGKEKDLEENLRIFVNCAATKGKTWNCADLPFYYDNKPWILHSGDSRKLLSDRAEYLNGLIVDLAKAEQLETALEQNHRMLSVNDVLNV